MAALFSLAARADTLTVSGYLRQVQAGNHAVEASRKASRAAADRADAEGALLYSPQGFAEAQFLNDELQPVSPAIQGTQISGSEYKVGVQGQTSFGMKAKLSSELDHLSLGGVSPSLVPVPDFHLGRQSLEVSQSFLRNGFGSEVRALERLVRSRAEAKSYSESFKTKLTLTAAEIAYWRLAAARESVKVKADSLERAKKIQAWNVRRDQLDLGKKADVLQADSAVKLAELDLQASEDEERTAAWSFNTARGADTDVVLEALSPLDPAETRELVSPARVGEREDLKAAAASAQAAQANAEVEIEKNRPALDVNASLGLGALHPDAATAYKDSFSTTHPLAIVGMKLAIPLAFGSVAKVKEAYRQEADAARLEYEERRFEQDREWKDLEKKFTEARHRLDLSLEIETAQRLKYENEKKRHDLGRTTTYQVLTFEQDYAAAQLTRIRLHAECLQLVAQMKLLGGAQ